MLLMVSDSESLWVFGLLHFSLCRIDGSKMKLFSMIDVVRRVGVPRHKITYALERGFIKEPQNLQGRRCFTEEEVKEIMIHFASKILRKK